MNRVPMRIVTWPEQVRLRTRVLPHPDRRKLGLERLEPRCLLHGESLLESTLPADPRLSVDSDQVCQEVRSLDGEIVAPATKSCPDDSSFLTDDRPTRILQEEVDDAILDVEVKPDLPPLDSIPREHVACSPDYPPNDLIFSSDDSVTFVTDRDELGGNCPTDVADTSFDVEAGSDFKMASAAADGDTSRSESFLNESLLPEESVPGNDLPGLGDGAEQQADGPIDAANTRSYFQPHSQTSDLHWTLRSEIPPPSVTVPRMSVAGSSPTVAMGSDSRSGLLQVGSTAPTDQIADASPEKLIVGKDKAPSIREKVTSKNEQVLLLRRSFRIPSVPLVESHGLQLASPSPTVEVASGLDPVAAEVAANKGPGVNAVITAEPIAEIAAAMPRTSREGELMEDPPGWKSQHLLSLIATAFVGQLVLERRERNSRDTAKSPDRTSS